MQSYLLRRTLVDDAAAPMHKKCKEIVDTQPENEDPITIISCGALLSKGGVTNFPLIVIFVGFKAR